MSSSHCDGEGTLSDTLYYLYTLASSSLIFNTSTKTIVLLQDS